MQSPNTNISFTEKLSDFQGGTVIGCHLSNKSVCQISALLEVPRSTVSADIVKRKHLGETTAQPQSSRPPHKLTKHDWRVLKRVARKNGLSSIATLTTEFQTTSGSTITITSAQLPFFRSFMKWVSMAEQPHTSLRSPCAMPSVGWSGVKLAAIGLWSSGNTFSVVMNQTSQSGFGRCQENATCPKA